MQSRNFRIIFTLVLCSCSLVDMSATGSSKKSVSKERTTKPQEIKTKSQTTKPATEPTVVTVKIPKFDFSKLTASSDNTKADKAQVADSSHPSKKAPSETCSTDMCKIMNGICNNNGKCETLPCSSDIVCKCDPGYTGQFCDRNRTEVNKAKEVSVKNGRIVSTESPRGKGNNGKQLGTTDKIATTGTVDTGGGTKSSNNNGSTLNGTHKENVKNSGTGVVNNKKKGKLTDSGTSSSNKYKQPKGSFIKGPEVPTPTASRPINVNVKRHKIKSKSSTLIEHFTDKVTISTVSVNFKQSLSSDVSGRTVDIGKGVSKANKKAAKQPTKDTKQNKNTQKNTKTIRGDLSKAKNIDRVVLTRGTVPILQDQSVNPVDASSASQARNPTKKVNKKTQ